MRQKIASFTKKAVTFILNPKLLFCFGIAWFITNGWSYVLMVIGTYFHIEWMMIVAGTYLTMLWFPFTPEKLITFTIAIALLKIFFPNDKKTLLVLKNGFEKAKSAVKKKRDQRNNSSNE